MTSQSTGSQGLCQALELLQKAIDGGDSISAYTLGVMYWLGEQVDKDVEKGLQLFKEAADQGCVYARNALGVHHYNIVIVTNSKESDTDLGDMDLAVVRFSIAAKCGHKDAMDQIGTHMRAGNA